jgi:multicomponent Na+:H+ antiporter subunit B
MIIAIDLLFLILLLATAVLALTARDLITSVALLSVYSLITSLLFAGLLAVDVAIVEAALGAGLTSLLMILAIIATTRHSTERAPLKTRLTVVGIVGVFLAVMVFSSTDLPNRGNPDNPAHSGISSYFLANSLEETNTPNVVTSLLADYRSADTLGETFVILTAALAATVVLARRIGDDNTTGKLPPVTLEKEGDA